MCLAWCCKGRTSGGAERPAQVRRDFLRLLAHVGKKAAAGAIALRVDVGPDGKVKTATIASSKLPDLNTATLEAVKKWSFKPGNRSIRVIVTYSLQ